MLGGMATFVVVALGCAPGIMYRKGLPFGNKPSFRRLGASDGAISTSTAGSMPCRYALFGVTQQIAGKLAFVSPAEADASILSTNCKILLPLSLAASARSSRR